MDAAAHQQIDNQDDNGRWRHDEDVDAELVAQAAALCLGGHDGGVGDEREIVAEEGTADDDGRHEGQIGARLAGYACGNGCKGGYRAHTGADGEGNETGSQKHTCQDHLRRQEIQREIDGGIDAAHRLGGVGKGTCQHEDPDHQHHLHGGRTATVGIDALHDRLAATDDDRIDARHHEGHSDGYLVEVTSDDAGDQIEYDEHQ